MYRRSLSRISIATCFRFLKIFCEEVPDSGRVVPLVVCTVEQEVLVCWLSSDRVVCDAFVVVVVVGEGNEANKEEVVVDDDSIGPDAAPIFKGRFGDAKEEKE